MKRSISNLWLRGWHAKPFHRTLALCVGLGVAAIGVWLLSGSYAASPFISQEAEGGSLSCGAAEVTNATVSNGEAVQFGNDSTCFVTRSGSKLVLAGKQFRFAGANIYWLGNDDNIGDQYPTNASVTNALQAAVNMHLSVVVHILWASP